MTDDTTTITVSVAFGGREYVRQVEGTHWARDDDRTLYVYNGDTTVLEVESEYVVEVLREEDVTTIASLPARAGRGEDRDEDAPHTRAEAVRDATDTTTDSSTSSN